MALVGSREGRNFGYGRQLSYAGPQALKDMFGGGHYGTVKAHSDRWLAFVRWCRFEQGPGINDARHIDRKVLADYAAYLRDMVGRGDLAVSTAQNRLSSVNRTMAALRGDQYVNLPSPSRALGMQRTGVRHSVPQGQDREQVEQIVDALCSQNQLRAAAIVLLARATGMRLREAILADLPRLSREANYLGRINIQEGTKGGRAGASAPRWIAVDDHIRGALGFAWQASPAGSRNLIAQNESYLSLLQQIIRPARDILHSHNLKGYHELRAAYACDRYEQITRHPAPINGGQCCQVDRNLDRNTEANQLRAGARSDKCGRSLHRRTDMTKPFDMELFLAGVLTGSTATRQRHLWQAKLIHAEIAERWQLDTPWRQHVSWFLYHRQGLRSEATRYYYSLTVRLLVRRLGKTWVFGL